MNEYMKNSLCLQRVHNVVGEEGQTKYNARWSKISWNSVVLVDPSCPSCCNLMDCSPPGSPVPGSPGKNTGVGCHFLLQCMKVKSEREVAQSCPTLSDPMDCSLPGSSIRGIFQARVLEWVAISIYIIINKLLEDWLFKDNTVLGGPVSFLKYKRNMLKNNKTWEIKYKIMNIQFIWGWLIK